MLAQSGGVLGLGPGRAERRLAVGGAEVGEQILGEGVEGSRVGGAADVIDLDEGRPAEAADTQEAAGEGQAGLAGEGLRGGVGEDEGSGDGPLAG